ncbi:MAG: ATP-binding protein [Oleiphilaceae bacterium]|nr:ATP-binding protein [Oleiphilaceae bacterium]
MSTASRTLGYELLKQLGFVVVIPLIVTIAFFIWQLYPQLKENVAMEQRAFAELIAERGQEYLITAEEQVDFLMPFLQGKSGDDLLNVLGHFVKTNQYFDSVYLLDYFGVVSYISNRHTEPAFAQELYGGIDMSKSPLIRHSETLTRPSWSDMFLSIVTGRLSIAYRTPIDQYTLIAEFALDRLPHLSEKLSEQGQLVMILDQYGQLIAHPDPSLSQQQINLSNLPFFRDYESQKVLSSEFELDGKGYFGSIVKMKHTPWYVIVAQDKQQFAASLYKILNMWLVSILIIVITAMILAYRRSRLFSSRFKRLIQHAKNVAEGRYSSASAPTPIQEFEDLSNSLSNMALAIEKRERTLQTKEQQLRNTLESAPNVAVQWYDDRGHVCYWNDASERIFGYSAEEAMGKRLDKLIFAPRPTAEFNMHLHKVSSGEERSREFELPFHRKNGKEGSIRGALFHIPGSDDNELYVCMATDVTKQRQAEASIRELNAELEARVEARTQELSRSNAELESALNALKETMEQLVQSEKLAALGSLVAGVAHELNTPIGNALMASSSLEDFTQRIEHAFKDGKMTRSSLEQFLEDARVATGISSRNLERASELISSFKQVAVDQSSSQRRNFVLAELVHEILVTLHPQTKKRDITVEVDVPERIELDSFPGPLGQVLSNLVMNAVTHAYNNHQHGDIEICAKLDGEQLAIQVLDRGVGIPDDLQNKIFNPFYTTRLGQGGSGLGLHIVHNLVTDVLGGQIEVKSEMGEGSCFTITLPRVAPTQHYDPQDPALNPHGDQDNNTQAEDGYGPH